MKGSFASPPDEVELAEFVMRRYRREDSAALAAAVTESLEHLRPWMPWIALEPTTLKDREKLFAQWDRDWADGAQYSYGMFLDDRVVGGVHYPSDVDAGQILGNAIAQAWLAEPAHRRRVELANYLPALAVAPALTLFTH